MDKISREEKIEFETQWVVYWNLFILNLKGIGYLILYILKQIICGFGLFNNTPEKDIRDQLVLITGVSSGIGRALSIEFAKKHCQLALVDIDEENGKILEEEIKSTYKIRVKFYRVDVSIYDDMEKLKANIEKDLGFVDILVNNAGVIPCIQTLNPNRKPADISKLIDVNLKAHIWAVKLFLPGMLERKRGHIVATCSLAGLFGCAYIVDYVSSKCGLRYFMDSLYLELLVKGNSDIIKTSIIFPSLVLTSDDVIKTIKGTKSHRYMYPWSPEKAAGVALKRILKNERYIVLPSFYKNFLSFLNMLPDEATDRVNKRFMEIEQTGFEYET